MMRQISVPQDFVGRSYGSLVHYLTIQRRLVPLGLYRVSLSVCESVSSPRVAVHGSGRGRAANNNVPALDCRACLIFAVQRKIENAAWKLPYVHTNPPKDIVLRETDRVFVLRERRGEWLMDGLSAPQTATETLN